jgi:sporulation protein YlmC with PRC-barrel domain
MSMPEHLRQRLADFHLGADVHSSDGRSVGTLHRVVVDQDTWQPHRLIVRESPGFSGRLLAMAAGLVADELVVPLSAVTRISRDRIDLSLTSTEVRRLPPYLSYRVAPVDPGDAIVQDIDIVFGAPPVPRQVAEADKAPGEIEVRAGESVMLRREAHRLGHVQDILFDEGELVGVVVRPTGLLQQDVLVQRRYLDRSDDGALFVDMTSDDLKNLEPYDPEQP